MADYRRTLREREEALCPEPGEMSIAGRTLMVFASKLDELLEGCKTEEDLLCNLMEAGVWVAHPTECPIQQWVELTFNRYDIEFGFDDRRNRVTFDITEGKEVLTTGLPYLVGRVIEAFDKSGLTSVIDGDASDFGFEYIDGTWEPTFPPKKAA